jgi:hypothetical protein
MQARKNRKDIPVKPKCQIDCTTYHFQPRAMLYLKVSNFGLFYSIEKKYLIAA